MALWAKGDHAQGRAGLEAAFEAHAFPERASASHPRRIEATAKNAGAVFVDANVPLQAALSLLPPTALFLDWCHPTEVGHRLIADAIAVAMAAHPHAARIMGRRNAGQEPFP